jgi:hypothetical protein
MAEFMFVYRHALDTFRTMAPEEMQQHMLKWQAWMNEGFQKGWMVIPGDGLKKQGRVVNGKGIVTDGPFVEAKEIVAGFTIVQADGLDGAVEIAQGCPGLLTGGNVEVRPLEGYTLKMAARPSLR